MSFKEVLKDIADHKRTNDKRIKDFLRINLNMPIIYDCIVSEHNGILVPSTINYDIKYVSGDCYTIFDFIVTIRNIDFVRHACKFNILPCKKHNLDIKYERNDLILTFDISHIPDYNDLSAIQYILLNIASNHGPELLYGYDEAKEYDSNARENFHYIMYITMNSGYNRCPNTKKYNIIDTLSFHFPYDIPKEFLKGLIESDIEFYIKNDVVKIYVRSLT